MNIKTIEHTFLPPVEVGPTEPQSPTPAEKHQWLKTVAVEQLAAEVLIQSLQGVKVWFITHSGTSLPAPILTELIEAYDRFKKDGLGTNCHDISSLAAHTKVGDGVVRSDNLSGNLVQFSDHSLTYKQLAEHYFIGIDFLAGTQINDGEPELTILVVEAKSVGDLCWRLSELYQGRWRKLDHHDWQAFYRMQYPDNDAQNREAVENCYLAGLLHQAFYAGEE